MIDLAAFVNPAELRDEDLQLELASLSPHRVHKVPTYHFRMVHAVMGEELGQINLRFASTPHIELYAGHVGYAVHPAHRGRHYASRALRLLMPMAFRLGLNPLWITCDPTNLASQRTLELAGAKFVEQLDVPKDCVIHKNRGTTGNAGTDWILSIAVCSRWSDEAEGDLGSARLFVTPPLEVISCT